MEQALRTDSMLVKEGFFRHQIALALCISGIGETKRCLTERSWFPDDVCANEIAS